jgi:hypothetical protein
VSPAAVSDSIRERLRRLDALSKSANENEAATARRIAANLRKRYGLDENPVAEEASDAAIEEIPLLIWNARDWSTILAVACAEAYGCLLLTESRVGRKGQVSIYCRLVGEPRDRDLAAHAFEMHFQRIEGSKVLRRVERLVYGGRLMEAWAQSEAVKAGGELRARSGMSEEERDRKMTAARAAVVERKVAR